jgi:multiple sugar transport system ATP-binding protein
MAAIQFDNVSKTYGNEVRAVADLDLDIADGEFVVLLGPSGCGKSTALRMVAGLEHIDGGVVRIGDQVVNDTPPRDRDVAMVFQNYALYPHMNVFDNIAFGLRMRGYPSAERRPRVERAAGVLGLADHLRRKPSQLSGGQRQRVAMGRAIVRQPKAFLMDEPLSNLDARLRVQMRTEIVRIQRELVVTTIYVTHDQVEAMTMADRVAVMRGGRLQQYGPPDVVYSSPVNLFVGSFIGSPAMNLIAGRIETRDGEPHFLSGSQSLRLPPTVLERRPSLAEHREGLALGFRPEALSIAGEHDSLLLRGVAVLAESLGFETLLYVEVEADPVEHEQVLESTPDLERADIASDLGRQATLVARLGPGASFADRERVTLTVDPARLHFFDATTGDAL